MKYVFLTIFILDVRRANTSNELSFGINDSDASYVVSLNRTESIGYGIVFTNSNYLYNIVSIKVT